MNTRGLVIVFGSLLAVIAMIVVGSFIGGSWGRGILALGIVGGIAWVICAAWLANAMNSDV